MDILHLIDRLEELFNESRPIWFTHSVVMDEDRLLDLIDQMRVAIPEEIKKAQQITSQKDRILAQAQEEASRTISLAREKADKMADKEQVAQAAQARADQIIAQSRQECEQMKRDADEYVLQTLKDMQDQIEKISNQVNNGIVSLQSGKNPSDQA
jgi:predicted  nucleic acid-binding Zn-ribbon protein